MAKQISLKSLLVKKSLKEDKVSKDILKDFQFYIQKLNDNLNGIEFRWKEYLRKDDSNDLKQNIHNIDGMIDNLKRFKKNVIQEQIRLHQFSSINKG